MRISVGIAITPEASAKEVHGGTAIDPDGVVRLDRKLANTPSDLATSIGEFAAATASLLLLSVMAALLRAGRDDVGHRQPARTAPPRANLRNLPQTARQPCWPGRMASSSDVAEASLTLLRAA
ncbi:hypothetical protein [Benzoatithermus flavus]|uniref:Uncharacterized protein n=1 Tax=Benzoatithermus flavus TaxID=3108223 RepID=A0ABU8Y0L5_9PROT